MARARCSSSGSRSTASIARAARHRFFRGFWRRAASVFALLLIWQIISLFMKPTILPSPIAVLMQLGQNLTLPNTYFQLGITMERVVGGMLISVTAGIVIGLASRAYQPLGL